MARLLNNSWHSFSIAHVLPSLGLTLLSIPLVPILEEIGWHGYGFDRLQEKYSALTAALIFGLLWGIWHTPAFLLQKSVFNLVSYFPYVFHAVIISIYFTWIYNNTGRSTLSAILFHIVIEICANTNLMPFDQSGSVHYGALLVVFATIIIYVYNHKTLTAQPQSGTI
jgi:membrane protease YdiL (CAAX protease family)